MNRPRTPSAARSPRDSRSGSNESGPFVSRLRRAAPDRRILFSAALLFLTFEPLGLWGFATIALVPWFSALVDARTRRETVKHGFWLGILMSLVAFYWVAYVIHQFGGVPWPLAIVGLGLFSFVGQPQFAIGALALRALLRRADECRNGFAVLGLGVLGALFYAGLDWVLPKMFVDTLGHALIHAPTLRQAADIGGPAFLTFLLLLANFGVFFVWRRIRTRGEPALGGALRAALPIFVLALVALVAADRYGRFRIAQVADRLANPKRTLQAAAIQANIGDLEKLASERGYRQAAERTMRAYFDLSDEALKLSPKPEVLLWPETAYPSTFRSPETSDDFGRDKSMEDFVASRKTPIAFGGYDRDMQGLSYNAVFYLDPDGTETRYAKTILIMFGEYIPGVGLFPGLRDLFPMVGFFGRGPGSVIREVAGVKTQPVICYEVLFPQFVRDAVVQGAEVLFNFTNDSWFGPVGVPYYHLQLAAFRSIETRIPQFRATNTGFSALVLPDGTITNRSKLYEPEIVNVAIPVIEPIPTLMVRFGDWFGKTAFALGLLGLALCVRRRRAP